MALQRTAYGLTVSTQRGAVAHLAGRLQTVTWRYQGPCLHTALLCYPQAVWMSAGALHLHHADTVLSKHALKSHSARLPGPAALDNSFLDS